MALAATGSISLGGSTAGRSVNLELKKAAGAKISLNDTAVRSLAKKASGVIKMSDLRGKSSVISTTVSLFTGTGGGFSSTNTGGGTVTPRNVDIGGNYGVVPLMNLSAWADCGTMPVFLSWPGVKTKFYNKKLLITSNGVTISTGALAVDPELGWHQGPSTWHITWDRKHPMDWPAFGWEDVHNDTYSVVITVVD